MTATLEATTAARDVDEHPISALLRRLRDDGLSWLDAAACACFPAEMWFPGRGDDSRSAKAVCERCPVRAECLEHALRHGEKFGIWGGKSERERRRLRRERRQKETC